MTPFFTTSIGRLRLLAFLEGTSLVALIFIAMPFKYYWNNPMLVKTIGPIHGGLFLAFVFYALVTGIRQKWKFFEAAWMILLASFIPFGTFYVDYKFFKNLHPKLSKHAEGMD